MKEIIKEALLKKITRTMAENIFKNLEKGSKVKYAETVEFEPIMKDDEIVDIKINWLCHFTKNDGFAGEKYCLHQFIGR